MDDAGHRSTRAMTVSISLSEAFVAAAALGGITRPITIALRIIHFMLEESKRINHSACRDAMNASAWAIALSMSRTSLSTFV
jgi:hypothetical protein